MFSATVIWVKSEYFWNTVLTWRLCEGRSEMSLPPKRTLPASGRSNPPMMRSVVVLPQPLGPRSVTNSFSLMYRLKSLRTTVSP